MKLKILNESKTETGSIDLPSQFSEPIRFDLIQRAFLSTASKKRQPYGAYPNAGKRASAEISRRRRKYRGSYGFGISRVPRKILSRRGTRMNWVGAFAPGTVGGRKAHPPKADKNWVEEINVKERRKAIRSAISATINLEIVKERNHQIPTNYPFVIEDKISQEKQTKNLIKLISNFGFDKEIQRAKEKDTTGLLIVTHENSKEFVKAISNIPGVQTVVINNLSVEALAPGGNPGRMTIFTESAIKFLKESKMFTKDFKGESQEKKRLTLPKKEAKKEAKKTIKKTVKKATPKKVASETKKKLESPKTEKKAKK